MGQFIVGCTLCHTLLVYLLADGSWEVQPPCSYHQQPATPNVLVAGDNWLHRGTAKWQHVIVIRDFQDILEDWLGPPSTSYSSIPHMRQFHSPCVTHCWCSW